MEENVDILDSGIEIVARPPGKEPRSISLLSGGEKTLTCVALLLAIFRSRPSPFCVLDEVDAALDEANIDRFTKVLQDFLAWTQFIIVTHSKKTMTCANTIYGVTMQESGVSKQVSVRFEDVSDDGHILTKPPPTTKKRKRRSAEATPPRIACASCSKSCARRRPYFREDIGADAGVSRKPSMPHGGSRLVSIWVESVPCGAIAPL